ncbi:hypothetical protein L7F22_035982 [Adiantum nelumboides]|nr:hypothetical protein [Adiantum nelumboides]
MATPQYTSHPDMAPAKRPRPFLRTSSRAQLFECCGFESPPPSSPAISKFGVGAPHRVIVGFDVRGTEENPKPLSDACESPRSVLESDALSEYHRHISGCPPASSPSPRSVLDRLLSGTESQPSCKEGVALDVTTASIKGEEPARCKNTFDVSVEGNRPIDANVEQVNGIYPQKSSFVEEHTSTPVSDTANDSIDVDFSDNDDGDGHDHLAANMPGSIFCGVSPFSHCCSIDALAGDFLSACFFCKCCLLPGKDIFMYRGDRAFCSLECRYQQIVIDELKERHSAASNSYHVPFP